MCRYVPPAGQLAAPPEGHPHSCDSPKSEFSATSSKVLIRDQTPSSAAVVAASAAGGKPQPLSFVQEASPFVEQQGVGSPASAGAAGPAGGAVGLQGRQQLGLWTRLLWALAKYRALLWRELLITTRWVWLSVSYS
jgi:hypothetical protein